MLWNELATPVALVDRDKVIKNTSHMSERMVSLGVKMRPHVKTHKCVEAARLQTRGHFGGITVSTLAEARAFGRAGFKDITYSVPIASVRLEEAINLTRDLEQFNLLLDHEMTLVHMERCSKQNATPLSIFLKVDCGYNRAGVDPYADESVKLAMRIADSPHVLFKGILTHAGHSYEGGDRKSVEAIAAIEREVMVSFGEKLRSVGITNFDVSIGSTPTMSVVDSLVGIDEVRPGNYVFYDSFQAMIGSCSIEDAAYSVLVSVIGMYPSRNELLIDGGALAFSKDQGPSHIDSRCGYGRIFSEDGQSLDDLRLVSLSQEHGKIKAEGQNGLDNCFVGMKLRIIPNHSCLSAALFERYYVVEGREVVEEWLPVRGW